MFTVSRIVSLCLLLYTMYLSASPGDGARISTKTLGLFEYVVVLIHAYFKQVVLTHFMTISSTTQANSMQYIYNQSNAL